jgi:2-hydroxyacyl-CoA lyase 1
VFAIVGDSAFGFSALELETATRYQIPFVVLIINNNGLFMGIEELPTNPKDIGVTNLNP